MERLADFQEIIERYFAEYIEYYAEANRPTTFAIVSSPENRHIQLLNYGHTPERWVFSVFMHFVITADGNVILLENNTEEEPFDELIEAGIPKSALQVGWIHPAMQAKMDERNRQAA